MLFPREETFPGPKTRPLPLTWARTRVPENHRAGTELQRGAALCWAGWEQTFPCPLCCQSAPFGEGFSPFSPREGGDGRRRLRAPGAGLAKELRHPAPNWIKSGQSLWVEICFPRRSALLFGLYAPVCAAPVCDASSHPHTPSPAGKRRLMCMGCVKYYSLPLFAMPLQCSHALPDLSGFSVGLSVVPKTH